MSLYEVNYDLIAGKDYVRLTSELRRLGADRMLLSCWILETPVTAQGLLSHLQSFIDADDRLMVSTLLTRPLRNASMLSSSGNLGNVFYRAFGGGTAAPRKR